MGTQSGKPPRIYRHDEQEIVFFYEHPIVAVRLDDGPIAVTLRSLCEGMGLNTQAQIRRAERTEALAGDVIYPWLETDIGPQEMPALILDVLPGCQRRLRNCQNRRSEVAALLMDYEARAAAAGVCNAARS